MKAMITIFVFVLLCQKVMLIAQEQIAGEAEDRVFYSPGSFEPHWPENYKRDRFVRDTLVIGDTGILMKYPWIGYPSRWTSFSGLNDTLQMTILLRNQTQKPFILTGTSVEKWFVPRVFDLEQDIHGDNPIADENTLKYRFSYHRDNPDTLFPKNMNNFLVYDVWNLPKGTYRLVAKPTEFIPKEFVTRVTGKVYVLNEAETLADTINSLEHLYLRLKWYGDMEAAKAIPDSILSLGKYSVVGWGLKKDCCWKQGEFGCAIAAIDSALRYLTEELDPAAPTPKERKEDEQAQAWYDHLIRTFESERAFIGG